jgi:hypothetical protein
MTLHYARRLTQKGLDRLAEIIYSAHEAMRQGRSVEDIDEESLEDAKELLGLDDDTNEFSERMPAAYAFTLDDDKRFETKYDLATYLDSKFPNEFRRIPWHSQANGLWEWLALFYAKQFRRETGKPLFGLEANRWIASLRTDNHRHHVYGPYLIYRYLRKEERVAKIFLNSEPGTYPKVSRVLADRQWAISCLPVLEVTIKLFWDSAKERWKEGAATEGPGGIVRLIEVLSQFDLTYDLYSLSADQLYNMLPKEFDRFKGTPESAAVAR